MHPPYNAEAAVDADSQVIAAADVTQEADDKKQLRPTVEPVFGRIKNARGLRGSCCAGSRPSGRSGGRCASRTAC